MSRFNIHQLTKLYYTIGEVASIFEVNTSLIRFWEKEFDFKVAKKTAKGNRLFTVKEIENFNNIYHLVKIEGFTLDGAKKALLSEFKIPNEKKSNSSEVIENLEKIKKKLIHLKKKN